MSGAQKIMSVTREAIRDAKFVQRKERYGRSVTIEMRTNVKPPSTNPRRAASGVLFQLLEYLAIDVLTVLLLSLHIAISSLPSIVSVLALVLLHISQIAIALIPIIIFPYS